jgi:hypothetical protein
MEKRVDTGCYAEDGLCKRGFHEASKTLILRFVDDSVVISTPEGTCCQTSALSANLYRPSPSMAEKWLDAAGDEGIQEMIRSMPAERH